MALLAYRRRLAERSATIALALCRLNLNLLANLQQHRGMNSALLAGDLAFVRPLARKGEEIDLLLLRLDGFMVRGQWLGRAFLPAAEIAQFLARWRRLQANLSILSAEESLAQHGLLITQLLKWLALLSEQRIEAAGSGLEVLRLRNYLQRLPALSEFLGQTRALGTRVAALSRCSAIERVRLMFLVARAEALLNQLLDSEQPSARALQAAQGVHEMARVVRTRMLLSSGIVIDAQGFYAIATEAINGVFAWVEALADASPNRQAEV